MEYFSTDELEDQEREEYPNKLWEVDDVLDSRGEGEQQEVLITWKNFSSEMDCWLDLWSNPELKSFLQWNQVNPDSTSLARRLVPAYSPDDEFRPSVHQAVFDELGCTCTTLHADRRRVARSNVKLHVTTYEQSI